MRAAMTCLLLLVPAGLVSGRDTDDWVSFSPKGGKFTVKMPANTLRVKGEAVCASVRGMAMEPCFTLTQLDERTFRGAITGLSFASCLFTQRGGRVGLVRTTSVPRSIHPRSLHSSVAEKE